MNSSTSSQSSLSHQAIKRGIAAHAEYYCVSRQVDGAPPPSVQRMTYDELLLFVVKQQRPTGKVVTCYEAGAFGLMGEGSKPSRRVTLGGFGGAEYDATCANYTRTAPTNQRAEEIGTTS